MAELTPLEQQIYNYVMRNPSATIMDVCAEFDLSDKEAIETLKTIGDKRSQKAEEN
jgi:DNA-binding MurR/RpiR family transcriptional regulator